MTCSAAKHFPIISLFDADIYASVGTRVRRVDHEVYVAGSFYANMFKYGISMGNIRSSRRVSWRLFT